MPSRADQPARRELTREAARRQAVVVLRVAESTCSYAAGQLADGLGPAEARHAAMEAAAELTAVVATLWRLAGLSQLLPAERAALIRQLVASGLSQRAAATRVGVTEATVRRYLAARATEGSARTIEAR